MSIYTKIDYLLKLNNLKQNNMCDAIKIPTSTYSSMKQRNSKSISIEIIRDISIFFNVSIDYFLNNNVKKEDFKIYLLDNSDEIIKNISQKYNQLDDYGKELVNTVLDLELKRVKNISP